jgi:hypothetical protein
LQFGTTSGNVTRSFLSWDMTAMEHAVISSATVYFYSFYSQSCTPAQWDMYYDTTAALATTTWANQPASTTLESTSTSTKGYSSSCDDGWISIDGKNFFNDAAATGSAKGYMQLRAHDESSTSIGFKQVRSRNAADPSQVPYAVVTYTSTPVIGTRTTVPSTACVTGSNRPFVNTNAPTLKTAVSQGNGATSTVNFEWWNVGGAKIGGASPTGIASGTTATATIPAGALAEGGNYQWRVDATSGGATSAWSPYCEFTVDTTAPSAAPTVSSATYPAGGWSGNTGTAGTFTLGAAAVGDVNSYFYGLDANPPTTSVGASALGGTATVSITPTSNGAHTLYVQSADRAGNRSTVTAYSFNVGSGTTAAALTSPLEGTVTAGMTQLTGLSPAGTTGVTYQWQRSATDPWVSIAPGDVTYTAGGGPVASWPVAPSGGVYPSLNWNVAQTLARANTPSGLAGRWMLNESSGSTAADSSGLGRPATTTSVTWSGIHGGSGTFNGSSSQAVTSGTVINTASNFSVSAWVNLASTAANSIAVSQNGTQQSGFDIRYNKSSNKWAFGRWNADIANAPTFNTASSAAGAPVIGTWTHLVGTYNSATGLMTLYVNGVAQANTATDTTPFSTTGAFVIGHGEFNASATGFFNGSIADVQAYSTVLTQAQVTALYTGGQAAGSGQALAGPIQVQAVFTGGGTTPVTHFTLDPNTASGATAGVGPGSVNLVTGSYMIGASDASDGANLGLGRTYTTRESTGSDPMFGPGWVSTVTAPTANYTGLTLAGTLVQLGQPDGSTLGFTQVSSSSSGAVYTPQVGLGNFKLTYTVNAIASPLTPADSYTLTDPSGNVTIFTHAAGAVAGFYNPSLSTPVASTETTTVSWQQTAQGVQPTQMLAPKPAGVSCTTLVKGCRAMAFTYATATTATGTTSSTWGDYTGRLKSISVTAWDPATSAMKTVVVSAYVYDINGMLTAQWDPRLDNGATHLWTTYSYDGNGILSTMTPPAQQPWTFTYTTVPGDTGLGRLAAVSRSALSAGTATTTVVYHVPVSGTGAPYNLSVAQSSQWGQAAAPVVATAVFGPDFVPTGNQTTGVMPSSYVGADITYLDANSRTVNQADGNGNITTTWYDTYGNTIQTLSAGNRIAALAAVSPDTPAQKAGRLSTVSYYSADGIELLDTFGPEHDIQLATGAVVPGRVHEHITYDDGATGGPYYLPTTDTTSVRWYDGLDTAHDDDTRTTTSTYNWTTQQQLTSVVDPSGLNLVTAYTYDPTTGLQVSVTQPGGVGTTNTPQTMSTILYQAGTGSGYTDCNSHPEWDGLACRTQVGGQAASGPEVLVKLYTYDMFDRPASTIEKTDITGSGGTVTRTTTNGYEPTTGRLSTVTITTATGLGTTVNTTKQIYDPASALLTQTQSGLARV